MKYAILLAATVSFTAGMASAESGTVKVSDHGDVVRTTEILKSGKGLEKISCRAFNALDESFKPQAVTYAADYTRKGRIKDPVVDVSGVETVTPLVVSSCRARPDDSLLTRVKDVFQHHKR